MNRENSCKAKSIGMKIFLLLVMDFILVFSSFVLCSGYTKINGCKKVVVTTERLSIENSEENKVPEKIELKFQSKRASPCGYWILLISYVLIALTVVVCLSIIVLNDDGDIRFEKLSALMTLNEDMGEKIASSIGNNLDVIDEKTLKRKNLYAELTKNLMNCITEI